MPVERRGRASIEDSLAGQAPVDVIPPADGANNEASQAYTKRRSTAGDRTISSTGSATLSNTAPRLAALAVSVVLAFAGVVWMLRRERK